MKLHININNILMKNNYFPREKNNLLWYHKSLSLWKTVHLWENEKGKWYAFLNWRFVFQHFKAVMFLCLTCTVSEKSVVISILVSEWVLGIVHLIAPLQLSFALDLWSFALSICKLAFCQRSKRTLLVISGVLSSLSSSLLSTVPSSF